MGKDPTLAVVPRMRSLHSPWVARKSPYSFAQNETDWKAQTRGANNNADGLDLCDDTAAKVRGIVVAAVYG